MNVFNKLKEQAEIKYYFDYNYNLNSIVFTGQIVKSKYQSEDRNPYNEDIKYMSKYTVMTYLMLLDKCKKDNKINYDFQFHQIYYAMSNWKGSGKYINENIEDIDETEQNYNFKNLESIGSPASSARIIDNLIKLGFIFEPKEFVESSSFKTE